MHRRSILQSAGMGLVAALGGCGSNAGRIVPFRSTTEGSFIGEASLAKRTEQVKRAGAGLTWIMEQQRPGLVRGTLNLRTHQAVVDVSYNSRTFQITYVSSMDVDYNPNGRLPGYEGPVIHRNYTGWVQNLDRRIIAESAI